MGCSIDWPTTFLGVKTVLDPVAAASWPIGLVAIFWLFRSELRQILPRIRSIKGAGVEADLHVDTQSAPSLEAQERERLPAGFGTEYPPPHAVYTKIDELTRSILDQEIQGDADKKLAWAIRMRSISEANRVHETNYRLIFGSQIRALKRLNLTGRAPASQFEIFFQEAAANPESAAIHEGRTFEEWGQFLFNVGYVREVPESDPLEVEITEFGQQFLIWMTEARASEYRLG